MFGWFGSKDESDNHAEAPLSSEPPPSLMAESSTHVVDGASAEEVPDAHPVESAESVEVTADEHDEALETSSSSDQQQESPTVQEPGLDETEEPRQTTPEPDWDPVDEEPIMKDGIPARSSDSGEDDAPQDNIQEDTVDEECAVEEEPSYGEEEPVYEETQVEEEPAGEEIEKEPSEENGERVDPYQAVEAVSEEDESVSFNLVAELEISATGESTQGSEKHKVVESPETPVKQGATVLEKVTDETVPEDEHEAVVEVDWNHPHPASSSVLEEEEDDEEQLQEEIDLDFVEQYDNTFNEFIAQNPKFLMMNPDLVHNLRVTKLQSLLTHQDEMEHELVSQLEKVRKSKAEMEASFQEKLREASRKKAARDIYVRTKLRELIQETHEMEATLTWQLIANSQVCAQNQQRLLEEFKKKRKEANSPLTHSALLSMIPDGSSFQEIRTAVHAPLRSPSAQQRPLTKDQEDATRQCQIDNAFMNGQIALLKKKLDYQKQAAAKQGWVESVLVRLDAKSMRKLKSRYKKKVGVQF